MSPIGPESEDDIPIGMNGAPLSLFEFEAEFEPVRLARRLARMTKNARTITKSRKNTPTKPTMPMVMMSWVLKGVWVS